MRTCAFLCTIALLSVPAAAVFSDSHMADSGFYVTGGGGVALVPNTTETPAMNVAEAPENKAAWDFELLGFGLGGAVGYDFGEFRTDAEFSFLSSKFDFGASEATDDADDSLTVLAMTANAWYDLDTGTAFLPYIGVGLGVANVSVTLAGATENADPTFKGAGWGFAYQAGVGVGFEVAEGFSLTAGYQFFGTLETVVTDPGEDAESDSDDASVSPSLMAHRIQLGLRYF